MGQLDNSFFGQKIEEVPKYSRGRHLDSVGHGYPSPSNIGKNNLRLRRTKGGDFKGKKAGKDGLGKERIRKKKKD